MSHNGSSYADIVDQAALQQVLATLHQECGIGCMVLDAGGAVLARSSHHRECEQLHRGESDDCIGCRPDRLRISTPSKQAEPLTLHCCRFGFCNSSTPIIVDGKHVATFLLGQFFTETPDLQRYREQASQHQIDERDYLQTIASVPVVSAQRIEKIARLYAGLLQTLGESGLSRQRDLEYERRRSVQDHELFYRTAVETCPDGYWMTDMQGNLMEVNEAYVRYSGYSREELLGMSISRLEAKEDAEAVAAHLKKVISEGCDHFVSRHRAKNGRIWDVEVSTSFSPMCGGRLFVFIKDITARKMAERELQLTKFAMDHARVEIYWLDKDARLHYVNRQACETLGYTFRELTRLTVPDLDPLFPVDKWQEHWQTLRRDKMQSFETLHKRKDGSVFPVEVVANYVKFGEYEYNVAFSRDISERKEYERKLEEQAHTDFLTGLTSRRYFCDLVEAELLRAERYGSPLSILLLDVDHFKQVNDTYGHKTGDAVLRKVADVCRETLREVDIVSRWGGEEFAILLPETPSERAAEVAERLRGALASAQIRLEDGEPIGCTVSIGCASQLSKVHDLDAIIAFADTALYEAKRTGRNRVCVAQQ